MHSTSGRRLPFCTRLCPVFLLALLPLAKAQQLYDAGLGSFPEAQGWSYGGLGVITRTLTNNSLLLDTSTSTSTQAGWGYVSGTDWNRTNGFCLMFVARLNSETHASLNRAGFSVILLGADRRGIELGFWTNTVFAQADSPLFTHAEEARVATSDNFGNYSLTLLATNYVLRANDATILSGPVRDYTAFNGFPNPYRTPNFIFFGDDTSSASASVNVNWLALVLPPSLTMPIPGVLTWSGVSNQTYRVENSTNLVNWDSLSVVTSQNELFWFTNNLSQSAQFFRVAVP